MTTVLQYVVIAALVGLGLFAIALFVFGRGEQLAPLPARTSPAVLPEQHLSGGDVRKVRFALALRGYRMSDVDWTLDRIADELDRTRAQLTALTELTAPVAPSASTQPGPDADFADADFTDADFTDAGGSVRRSLQAAGTVDPAQPGANQPVTGADSVPTSPDPTSPEVS